jgi:hypothetical protein
MVLDNVNELRKQAEAVKKALDREYYRAIKFQNEEKKAELDKIYKNLSKYEEPKD